MAGRRASTTGPAGPPTSTPGGTQQRHRSKTARKRVGKVVPAAGVAAALAVGAVAYGLVAGTGSPQAAQLSTDLAVPVTSLSSSAHAGAGGSAASAMIAAARTASSAVATASARLPASRSPKTAKPTVAPSFAPASTAAPQTSDEPAATAIPSATPTAQATHSSSGGSAKVAADIADGDNTLAIGQYLVDNGYSIAAAAGVASCVDGESGANPESVGDGGGGLIGWTPLGSAQPDGNIVTGDASADMMTQLADILYYNADEIGQSKVAELDSQTDPVAAADFYSQNFEKPAVTDSDVVPSVAENVYSELGG